MRPETITAVADHRPGLHAFATDEALWWLPTLGPSATLVGQLIARTLVEHADGVELDCDELARSVGLGSASGKLWAAMERLDNFGAARFVSTNVLAVRLHLPRLDRRKIDRLPPHMATAYEAMILETPAAAS